MSKEEWIVVSDFDGTIALKDIGNEIHKSLKPEDFVELQQNYRAGKLKLTELQPAMWNNFPMSAKEMETRAVELGELRDGAAEFFELCADQKIPVFVASCGILNYIEPVLRKQLSPKAFENIKAIECNRGHWSEDTLERLTPPYSTPDSEYPMDKGAWALKMREEHRPKAKILGIGNGTSDRSFHGKVDHLAATEGLQRWAEAEGIKHSKFDSFKELHQLLF